MRKASIPVVHIANFKPYVNQRRIGFTDRWYFRKLTTTSGFGRGPFLPAFLRHSFVPDHGLSALTAK